MSGEFVPADAGLFLPESGEIVGVDYYPDGMPRIQQPASMQSGPLQAGPLLLRARNLREFCAGMFFVDALRERGHVITTLIVPSVPGARQDRINPRGDFLFTLKSIAGMINARQFRRVVMLDPHSLVAPALIDRSLSMSTHSMLGDHFRGMPEGYYVGVVAPDAGAVKRGEQFATKLKVPLHVVNKTRDLETGAVSYGENPHLPAVGRWLVVDDICDGGATFVELANAFKEEGMTFDLLVTHGYFSRGTSHLLALYDAIYCTDSVLAEREGVTVIDVCHRLLDYAL